MGIDTTMTGSFFRTDRIKELLSSSKSGEISQEHQKDINDAERIAIRDQLHPGGAEHGLSWVSNGEQRKSGYTTYLPNRFSGFSKSEKTMGEFSTEFFNELIEANPMMASVLQERNSLNLNRIEDQLQYTGEELARREATDAARIAREEGATRIFVPSPSPGVITVFYPPGKVYDDHRDYLFSIAREISKEYREILAVPGVDLQIDAPDLAMAKSLGVQWDVDFYDALHDHIEAINESIAGLPADRIRVHYCYGNYASSHLMDPPYERVLPELVGLRAGTVVGEMANPRHAGDPVIIRKYVKEFGWPKNLKFAAGVIDVKSPFVETPETVALKLRNLADIDGIGPERVLGGTDCGFETFDGLGNVPKSIALKKLASLAEGARMV